MEDPRAGANYGLVERCPCQPYTRRELPVLRIFLIPTRLDFREFPSQAGCRLYCVPVHVADLAELLGVRCLIFPAKAEVERELVCDAVVILNEEAVIPLLEKKRIGD